MPRRFLVGAAFVALASCGSKGGDVAKALLCGMGHTKGLMSVGLNFNKLQDLGVRSSNNGFRDDLNQLLSKANISPNIINIKTVESVKQDMGGDDANDDSVRFLELGGQLGGLGVATSQLFKAVGQSEWSGYSLTENRFFSFARESFRMSVAADVPPPALQRLENILSFPFLTATTPHENQWALKQTDFAGAVAALVKPETMAALTRPIVVAVVDTGVDLGHDDLKDILIEGRNFVEPGKPPQDGNGHGTHCAGIIASLGKNGGPIGVAAPLATYDKIRIMPIKVLADNGSGDSQAVEKGIRWAAEHGADVISMSLGGGRDYSDAKREGLTDAVLSEAIAKGAIVVVAAGNESCPLGGKCKGSGILSKGFSEYIVHPCSYEGTICVGATSSDETLASYSNYSSKKTTAPYRHKVDVNAPGTNIYSTWPRALANPPYKSISGTSMATPFVAGIAALVKANNPDARQEDLLRILRESQVFPEPIREKSEEGRVDLGAIANNLYTGAVPTPTPNPVKDPTTPEGQNGSGEPLGLETLWSALCNI
jgi:subtilisin family serine protease